MNKWLVLFLLVSLVILSGCSSSKIKKSLETNQHYLNFKNANIGMTDELEKIPAEKFETLDITNYCFESVTLGDYFKYKLIAGSKAQIFVLDKSYNLICSYQVTDKGILFCDWKECKEKKEMLFAKINSINEKTNRNVHLKGKDTFTFDFKINGEDYVTALNKITVGAGDILKEEMEKTLPSDPVYFEYYELGNKTKLDDKSGINTFNTTRIITLYDGLNKNVCFEDQEGKLLCGSADDKAKFDFEKYNDIYGQDLLNKDVLSNDKINVESSLPSKGRHCLKISISDKDQMWNMYAKSDFISELSDSFDQISGEDGTGVKRFSLIDERCIENNILVKKSFIFEIVSKDMSFKVGGDEDIESVETGKLADSDFRIPSDAITECKETCEKNSKCFEPSCNVFTMFKCNQTPVADCCGNKICENGESYDTCSQDCKGIKDSIKNKALKDFLPEYLMYGTLRIGVYKNDANALIDKERSSIYASYFDSYHEGSLVLIDVSKGTNSNYQKISNDYSEYQDDSVVRFGYKKDSFTFRDVKIDYVFKDLYSYCGSESYESGSFIIRIPEQNTIIYLGSSECQSISNMKEVIKNYLAWLSESESEEYITIGYSDDFFSNVVSSAGAKTTI